MLFERRLSRTVLVEDDDLLHEPVLREHLHETVGEAWYGQARSNLRALD